MMAAAAGLFFENNLPHFLVPSVGLSGGLIF
jgi:hypothetical protein